MFVGTPKRVADQMEEWFTAPACDGFVLAATHMPGSYEDVTRLLVPELQRRGLFHKEYEGATLRETLGLPIPARGGLASGTARWQRGSAQDHCSPKPSSQEAAPSASCGFGADRATRRQVPSPSPPYEDWRRRNAGMSRPPSSTAIEARRSGGRSRFHHEFAGGLPCAPVRAPSAPAVRPVQFLCRRRSRHVCGTSQWPTGTTTAPPTPPLASEPMPSAPRPPLPG